MCQLQLGQAFSISSHLQAVLAKYDRILLANRQWVLQTMSDKNDTDCFHTRAKCATWMIIRIAQFELRRVHKTEVTAIFELRSVHTRDRICGLVFQSGRRCVARVWVPCQSNMHEARVSYASVQYAAGSTMKVVRRSRTCSSAPPKKKKKKKKKCKLEVKAFIRRFRCDLRDASLEKTSGPSFELRNSNYPSRCNFAYTQSKIPSFEWSFKLCISNDQSNLHFALVWKQSSRHMYDCMLLESAHCPLGRIHEFATIACFYPFST